MNIINKKPNPFSQHEPILLTIIITLSIISFYTSFDGFITMSFGSLSKTPSMIILLLFVLVVALQSILVYALFKFIDVDYLILRITWLFCYGLVMLVSVFFSYSFYYNFIRADNFAEENALSQARQVKDTFQSFQNEFDNIRSTVIALSEYSSEMSERERNYGKTCDPNIGKGNGPRRHFRDQEATLFQSFVTGINALQKKIIQDISMIAAEIETYKTDEVLNAEAKVNQRITKVNLYKDALILKEIKQVVAEHTGDNRYQVQSIDPSTNQRVLIDCPDPAFDRKAKLILSSLNKLQPIPPVKFFNPNDDKQRFARTFAVFIAVPSIGLGTYAPEDTSNAITKWDMAPIAVGFFIDFLIFLICFADGITKKTKNQPINDNYEGQYFGVEGIKAIGDYLNSSVESDVFSKLQKYCHSSLLSKLFFVPVIEDATDAQEQKIVQLFNILEANGQVTYSITDLPAKGVHKSVKKRLNIQKDDPRFFNVFKMSKKAWREMVLSSYVIEHTNKKKHNSSVESDVFSKLQKYCHSSLLSMLFFVPVIEDATDAQEKKIVQLFNILEAKGQVTYYITDLPAKGVHKSVKKRLNIQKHDPRFFNVFKMSKKAWKKMLLSSYVI
ncbi:MAG: hypothetical protein ABFS56_24415 [Pseudomonadota bacterium]